MVAFLFAAAIKFFLCLIRKEDIHTTITIKPGCYGLLILF